MHIFCGMINSFLLNFFALLWPFLLSAFHLHVFFPRISVFCLSSFRSCGFFFLFIYLLPSIGGFVCRFAVGHVLQKQSQTFVVDFVFSLMRKCG